MCVVLLKTVYVMVLCYVRYYEYLLSCSSSCLRARDEEYLLQFWNLESEHVSRLFACSKTKPTQLVRFIVRIWEHRWDSKEVRETSWISKTESHKVLNLMKPWFFFHSPPLISQSIKGFLGIKDSSSIIHYNFMHTYSYFSYKLCRV